MQIRKKRKNAKNTKITQKRKKHNKNQKSQKHNKIAKKRNSSFFIDNHKIHTEYAFFLIQNEQHYYIVHTYKKIWTHIISKENLNYSIHQFLKIWQFFCFLIQLLFKCNAYRI